MLDFLSGYHKELIHKLNNVGLSNGMNVIRKCQTWVIAQNCETVKAFHSRHNMNLRTLYKACLLELAKIPRYRIH